MDRNLGISLRENWLELDGRKLKSSDPRFNAPEKLSVTPEGLRAILDIGTPEILPAVEAFYERTRLANPKSTVVRPSVFTAHLGTAEMENLLLTHRGQHNGGNITERNELSYLATRYWDAVHMMGFQPELRRTSGQCNGGLWILLRRPSLLQVNSEWLGTPFELPEVNPDDNARRVLGEYADRLAEIADSVDDVMIYRDEPVEQRQYYRSRLQIGRIIAISALKISLHTGEPEDDIEDALDYARNDPTIGDDIERAIRNYEPSW